MLFNLAPWTLPAIFIIMGALVRSGALNVFTAFAVRTAKKNSKCAIGFLIGCVVVASRFVSNTLVVLVLLPVFVALA